MAAYDMYPNPAKDYLNITFDDVTNLAALPEQVILYSEKSTTPAKTVQVKTYFKTGLSKRQYDRAAR